MKLLSLLSLTATLSAVSVYTAPTRSTPSRVIPAGTQSSVLSTPAQEADSNVDEFDFNDITFGDESEDVEQTVVFKPHGSYEEIEYYKDFYGESMTEKQSSQLSKLFKLRAAALAASFAYTSEEQSSISAILKHLEQLKESFMLTILSPEKKSPQQATIIAALVSMQEKQYRNLVDALKLWETEADAKTTGVGRFEKFSSSRKHKSDVFSSLHGGSSTLQMAMTGSVIYASKINDLMNEFYH